MDISTLIPCRTLQCATAVAVGLSAFWYSKSRHHPTGLLLAEALHARRRCHGDGWREFEGDAVLISRWALYNIVRIALRLGFSQIGGRKCALADAKHQDTWRQSFGSCLFGTAIINATEDTNYCHIHILLLRLSACLCLTKPPLHTSIRPLEQSLVT